MGTSSNIASHDAITRVDSGVCSGVRRVAEPQYHDRLVSVSSGQIATKIRAELAELAAACGTDRSGWRGVPTPAGWLVQAYVGVSTVAIVTHEDLREALALLYGELLLTGAL